MYQQEVLEQKVYTSQTLPVYLSMMAGYLQLKGFVLLDTKPNYKSNDGKIVYYFKKSPELQVAIDYYKTAKDNHEILNFQIQL